MQNSDMDQSDDDNSFQLVGSEDLHTDKSDHSDGESFEIIGSEELNSVMKHMEKVDHGGSISEENDIGVSDTEDEQQLDGAGRYSDKSAADSEQSFSDGSMYSWDALPINVLNDKYEQQLDDVDRYSDNSAESEQSYSEGSTYSWDALPITELDDKYKGSRRRDVVYDMDGTAYVFRPNLKLIKDKEIKDVAKDHIIPFLPAKSLVRFRAVSKEWDNWISHPFLAHMQTFCFQDMSGFFCQNDGSNHYFVSLNKAAYGIPDSSLSFLPWMVKIRSSCNGLLLCEGVSDEDSVNEYYICNPANKGFHVLPRSTYYHGPQPNLILAFEPSLLNCGEDYKVICAFDIYNGPPMLCFDIYSSKTRSWTCCNAICTEIGSPYLKDNGLYKNGVAYWATSSGELLAFDTVSDFCGVQPICSDVKDGGILTLIEGELSYIQSYIEPSDLQTSMQTGIFVDETQTGIFGDETLTGGFVDGTADVKNRCVIEIFGGANMCLKRRDVVGLDMKIYNTRSFRVLFAVKSNLFIFNIDDVLYSCDVKKAKFEVIKRGRMIKSSTTYIPYVNSLVSLP